MTLEVKAPVWFWNNGKWRPGIVLEVHGGGAVYTVRNGPNPAMDKPAELVRPRLGETPPPHPDETPSTPEPVEDPPSTESVDSGTGGQGADAAAEAPSQEEGEFAGAVTDAPTPTSGGVGMGMTAEITEETGACLGDSAELTPKPPEHSDTE